MIDTNYRHDETIIKMPMAERIEFLENQLILISREKQKWIDEEIKRQTEQLRRLNDFLIRENVDLKMAIKHRGHGFIFRMKAGFKNAIQKHRTKKEIRAISRRRENESRYI